MPADPIELIYVDVKGDISTLEADMGGAARVVDTSAQRMAQSIQRTEQTIVRSSSNAGDAMTKTGGSARLLGQQFSQVGQQVAAGASPLQALAIQLPDLALAMSATGAQAGSLAAFFGGPWGIALTTAAAVAISLAPAILGIGDAADETSSALDNMIKKLRQAQAEKNRFNSAGQELGELVKRRGELEAEIRQRGVRNSNGQLQFVFKQQQELAEVNRKIAESRAAIDAERSNALNLNQSPADVIYNIRNPDEKKERRTRARSTGASAAERAAKQAAEEAKRQDELYEKTRKQLKLEQTLAALRGEGTDSASRAADKLEAIARLQQQFPKLAESTLNADQDRFAILTSIATATVDEAHNRDLAKKAAEEQAKVEKQSAEDRKKAADELARRQETQIRTLAGLYEDAFRGGTAAIWQDFKEIGLAVVAQVLARFTLAKLGGGSFDLGSAIGSALGAVLLASPLAAPCRSAVAAARTATPSRSTAAPSPTCRAARPSTSAARRSVRAVRAE